MGITHCPTHGVNKPRRWASHSIAEALERDGRFPHEIRHVVVVYPDQARAGITFVDVEDHAAVQAYVAKSPRDLAAYAVVPRLVELLPADDIVLVFHDRVTSRLNDKVFILKITKRLRSVCAACLREALRARGEAADDDLDIPDIGDALGTELSPYIMRRLMNPALAPDRKV